MQFDNDYDGDDDKVDDVPMFDYNIDSSEQMDEHMAALVLTSLSCSPASPACVPGAANFLGTRFIWFSTLCILVCRYCKTQCRCVTVMDSWSLRCIVVKLLDG